MKCLDDFYKRNILCILFAAAFLLLPQLAGAECDCTKDTAVPPFLAEGVDANLLLMIDNSASMLDQYYTDTTSESNGIDDDGDGSIDEDGEASLCFDETYDPDETYVGYFDNDTWYAYNLTGDGTRFEIVADGSYDNSCDGDATCSVYTGYYDADADGLKDGDEEAFALMAVTFSSGNALDEYGNQIYLDSDGNEVYVGTFGNYVDEYGDQVYMDVAGNRLYDEDGDGNFEDGDGNPVDPADIYVMSLGYLTELIYDDYVAETFKGKGNFLNWALASRFDIEKKILTGGKYDDGTGLLESESRGCSANRFIRQFTADSDGTQYKLVLGITTDDDADDWVNTTLIDIFPPSTAGFDPGPCQEAIDLMMGDPGGFGGVKQAIIECMEYQDIYEHHRQEGEHDKQALVHSLHDCWFIDKTETLYDDWNEQGFNFEKWCSEVYERVSPSAITSDDPAYICSDEYIGRCWDSGALVYVAPTCDDLAENERCVDDVVWECTDWKPNPSPHCKSDADWQEKEGEWIGGVDGDWLYGVKTVPTLDECIKEARWDFCGVITTPEVVDPSDLETTTGEAWNLPAMLMDQGAAGQLGIPMYTAKGFVEAAETPSGLLQEFSGDLRIGAMAFNYDGAVSECNELEAFIDYSCGDIFSQDGAEVIQGIDIDDPASTTHTDSLVAAINSTRADAWTPLAEAMYTAIGYYAQDFNMELNSNAGFEDYSHIVEAPITAYCQSNNVLFITDGSSTADLNPTVISFFEGVTDDSDGDSTASCGDLNGSTLFDDLAFYARQGDVYSNSPYAFESDPENINTWIVYTGDPNDTGDECAAYTLMQNAVANGGPNAVDSPGTDEVLLGGDADALSQALRDAFESILKRAAAGSAASVISATRSGEGAVYQAIFWPAKTGPEVSGVQLPDVTWTGEVHALLMDSDGNLYEDTNSNHALDLDTDERIVFYFSEEADETVACYGELDVDGACTGDVKGLDEVQYLWSAAEWLSGIEDGDIDTNRASYLSQAQERYIYTWNDINNNGGVDTNEWIAFEPATNWSGFSEAATRGAVPYDFIGTAAASCTDEEADARVDAIVSWIRGEDAGGYRSRTLDTPANFDIARDTITWRLGDVIYSTPTAVARPEENYHLVYRDSSYANFVKQYKNRRHMIYFGANDGMIHAVNGGFFDATTKKFYTALEDDDGDGVYVYEDSATAPALGAEMWAYVPYNLQPQLKCLRETSYDTNHKYFVDLKPRMFDVQIFGDDDNHPDGWGTIMVAGMRFGGGSVDADAGGDSRKFVSAYTIFDITNPEQPPVLLGELTYKEGYSAHMGYTTIVPVVVPMKETDPDTQVADTKWYLVFGNGPLVLEDTNGDGTDDTWVYNTAIGGVSNQAGKLAVFPLDNLITGDGIFRIPDTDLSVEGETATSGIFTLEEGGTEVVGFTSDPISVDFDLTPDYRADAVYFGTVEGDWTGWAGRFYRLVTNADDGISEPVDWELKEMLNPERPVTAAPMAGWDGQNFWIYFGTGRFFDEDDKSNFSSVAQESYYGLKEPVSCSDGFTFEWPTLVMDDLQPVGSIRVSESPDAGTAALSCAGGGDACLPVGVTMFSELDTYIAGTGCVDSDHTGMGGWVHDFDLTGERNLGQSTLLGGLLTFTTYQPFDDLCRLEGEAFLYAVYFRTGTAWHESVFDDGGSDPVEYKKDLGRGLATTPNLHVGKEEGGTAYAQTSTGAIVEIEQPNMPIDDVKTGRMYWRTD